LGYDVLRGLSIGARSDGALQAEGDVPFAMSGAQIKIEIDRIQI
jgi:hypothetical protein